MDINQTARLAYYVVREPYVKTCMSGRVLKRSFLLRIKLIDTYGQIFGTKMKTHFGSFTETPIPTFEMRAMLYP